MLQNRPWFHRPCVAECSAIFPLVHRNNIGALGKKTRRFGLDRMGRSEMRNFVGIFMISCFLVLCNQAQGRPGKPFHPCGSYFISYSHSQEQTLAVAIPINKGSEISENPTVFGVIYSYSRVFPITNSKGPKPHLSAHRTLHSLPENIFSLLIALLFGIACGAITSITIYVVWSLLTNRYASPDAALDVGYMPLPTSVKASK